MSHVYADTARGCSGSATIFIGADVRPIHFGYGVCICIMHAVRAAVSFTLKPSLYLGFVFNCRFKEEPCSPVAGYSSGTVHFVSFIFTKMFSFVFTG